MAALLIMCLNFVLTTASLSIVHEFMPEHESLPDVILNNIPYQEWALYASELTIQIQVGFAIAMCIFHKHRYETCSLMREIRVSTRVGGYLIGDLV